jgi:hypothetical protein
VTWSASGLSQCQSQTAQLVGIWKILQGRRVRQWLRNDYASKGAAKRVAFKDFHKTLSK